MNTKNVLLRISGPAAISWVLLLITALAGPVRANFVLEPEQVRQWTDDFFSQALAERRISGALVTVVQGGEIILNSGYGNAELGEEISIDPEHTKFRIGSNTKTFTGTAIAQLLEKGLISSLDDPANQYLKRIQLPSYRGTEVSLRHLLTHSAGFAHRLHGLGTVTDHSKPQSAGQLAQREVQIVRPPGGRSVYSNYGTAVLGVLIEDVTGVSIANYFNQNIFKPLGMDGTVLNVSADPSADVAVPYGFFPNGESQRIDHVALHPFFAPAGSVDATGLDMGRYMIAQLNAGKRGDSRLGISEATFALMHSRLHSNHPDLQGWGMLFLVDEWADQRSFGHGGDWEGFHSWMTMWPDSEIGVFIGLLAGEPAVGTWEGIRGSERLTADENNPVKARLQNIGVMLAFKERFIGPDTPPYGQQRLNVDDLVGEYRTELRAYGTMVTFFEEVLIGGSVLTVEKAGANSLIINGIGPYEQTKKGVFWSAEHGTSIDQQYMSSSIWAFSWDEDLQNYYIVPRIGGVMPAVKVGMWSNPSLYSSIFLLSLLVLCFGLTSAFWQIRSTFYRVWQLAAVLTPVCALGSIAVMLFGYPPGESAGLYLQMIESQDRFLWSLLLANLAGLGAAILVGVAGYCWFSPNAKKAGYRLRSTLLGVAGVGLITVFQFGNMLGFNLP